MKFIISGRDIEVTEALKDYAKEKVGKISKYFDEDTVIEAQISLHVENQRHMVEVTMFVDGLILRGEKETGDMYASIDGVVDKLARQVRKYKSKIRRKLREEKLEFEEEIVEARHEDDEEEEEPKIVKTKRFAMKPMGVQEAAMQMDLLHHDFFVFSNAETDEVNVVYKRKDGNYGLIEPTFK
ncbi:MAG: ribosome hibernation-promoting factor, HPF/YfiA family [Bacillota bacterium]